MGYPRTKSKLSKKYGAHIMVHDEFYQDIEMDELMHEYEKKFEDWKMQPVENIMNKI